MQAEVIERKVVAEQQQDTSCVNNLRVDPVEMYQIKNNVAC